MKKLHTTKSFSDSNYYKPVLNVKRFMFADIQNSLSLKGRAPNFLLALGLFGYIEYWGKLKLGVKPEEQMSEKSFNEFLYGYLDPIHYPKLKNTGVDIYKDVRCGLAHVYLIEQTSNIDAAIDGGHGIEFDSENMRYTFYVKTYFLEFKAGVNKYINGLETGTERLDLLERCLNGRPVLI